MFIFKKIALVLGLCCGLAGMGQATVLTYEGRSVAEFDLFQQWFCCLSVLPHDAEQPQRDSSAALHISFDNVLQDTTFYGLSDGRVPDGYEAIDTFSLTMKTSRGSYNLPFSSAFNMFDVWFETGIGGVVEDWGIDLDYSSGTDGYRLKSVGGTDEVDWLLEYIALPDSAASLNRGFSRSVAVQVSEASGSGIFTDGALSVISQNTSSQVSTVPLPGGVILLPTGFMALASRGRTGPPIAANPA